MSNEIFDRRYSLIIGRPSTKILTTIPNSLAREGSNIVPRYLAATKLINNSSGDISRGIAVDYRTTPDQFIEIRDLSMRAKIVYKKSGNKGGDQFSTIELDNLSEDTKNSIRENDLIFLKAGYKQDIGSDDVSYEDLPLLLSAQITKVETKRNLSSATRTTEIICGDNILPKKSIKISKSWPANTSKRKVLDDLLSIAQSNFVPIGKVSEEIQGFISPLKEVYPFGYNVAGNLFEEISKLCESVDYRFYTVLGKIYIEPKLSTQTFETFIIENKNLKEPLERHSDNSGVKQGSKGAKTGLSATTYLNGRILTNMVLSIENYGEDWDGTYPIESITHNLDFEGQSWDTRIKTVRL